MFDVRIKKEHSNRESSEEGFILVTTVLVLAAAILGPFYFYAHNMQEKNQFVIARTLKKNNFLIFKENVETLIEDPASWEHIVNTSIHPNSTVFNCLRHSSLSCAKKESSFLVMTPDDKIFFDPEKQGLDFNGQICNENSRRSHCPFHVKISWSPLCLDSSCSSANAKIVGQFVANERAEGVVRGINLEYLEIDMIKEIK